MSGLDLNKKPSKPEKKRIVSSVLLSSVKRLGMCVYNLVCVCVCVCVCSARLRNRSSR